MGPSDQNRAKKSKKKSNFTCTLEHNQPPSDQKIRSKPIKKIKFHLYTRAQSTPIRSKNPIKTDQKNQKKIKFHLYTRAQSTPIRSKNPIKTDQKNQKIQI